MKGAKNLRGLLDRILQKFKFKKFKLVRKGKHIRLYGEVNPWVLLIDGTMQEIPKKDFEQEFKRLKQEGKQPVKLNAAEYSKLNKLDSDKRIEISKNANGDKSKIDFDSIKEPTPEKKSRNKPKERLPRTGGKWEGEPGNGKWYSDHSEVKEVIGDEPIIFKDGKPDFSRWSNYELEFELGQLNGTDALLKSQGLTPHHLSNTEIQMIPSKLHGNIPHKGSASEMRNAMD
ncbi:HNH endonuclease [Paenibacillus sp. FSL R7-0204]|uniref:HNH endonuclease n=1 Tax=Paenibacillus sp. FSL R7-0204 TaxID=2921675 RepID=UPI0030F6E691